MNNKSRWKELMQKIADDIKACGNLCDAYAKKGLVGMFALGSDHPRMLIFFSNSEGVEGASLGRPTGKFC